MECEERESYAFWFGKVFQDLLTSELASYTLLVLYFSLAPRNQVVSCIVWEQKIIRNSFPLQSRLSGCQVVRLSVCVVWNQKITPGLQSTVTSWIKSFPGIFGLT